ncbi:MAG: TetR/AcrR family transcriptional regulator [Actinobacteria bacterium]|nr:TetR/AcrR family transcriptional regulator [Actinomycetota bacterium]
MPRRDKRADIVNAGIRIFSRKGFQRCSVEDILQEAHVARATFYSYFDSKKDLFLELVDTILNNMFEIAAREFAEMPNNLEELKEKTKNAFIQLYNFFAENLEFSAIYIQEVMGMNPEIDYRILEWQQRVDELVKMLINRGIEMGMFRPLDVDVVATMVAGAPQHLGLHLFLYKKNVDVPRVAEAIADYLIYGLAARN